MDAGKGCRIVLAIFAAAADEDKVDVGCITCVACPECIGGPEVAATCCDLSIATQAGMGVSCIGAETLDGTGCTVIFC